MDNDSGRGSAVKAMRAAVQFAKSLASAIAGNWLDATKSLAKSGVGKCIICIVLVVAIILTTLIPILIGSLVGWLVELASEVVDLVGDAFAALGDLLFGGSDAPGDSLDTGYMQKVLAGTPWEVEFSVPENAEDMNFTDVVNVALSKSSEVVDAYIAQRCGDYVALADTIASTYSGKGKHFNGVYYNACRASVKVNTMAVPANMGKKIMCAYIAQTNSLPEIIAPSLCDWVGKRSPTTTQTVIIEGNYYSIPAYMGRFAPAYQYDELLQGGSDYAWLSLIDEIVYISSVNEYCYVTYEEVAPDGTVTDNKKPGMKPVLNCNLTINIGVRDMDEIVYDTIGLWTGESDNYNPDTLLNNNEYTGDVNLQSVDLLKYQWTGSDGTTYTRQSFNQMYYYELYSKVYDMFAQTDTASGDGSSIVAAAQKECALYEQDTSLSGGDKYWSWYYEGQVYPHHPEPWCVCFVYWCATQCGYVSETGCFGPNVYVNCRDIWEDFKARGQTHTEADFLPQPGDLVLFGSASCLEHIGIVESYNTETSTLTTLEGNVGDTATGRYDGSGYRIAARRYYTDGVYGAAWAGTKIYGYIRPAYPSKNFYRDMVFMKYEASDNPAAIGYDVGGGWSYGLVQFNTNDKVIDGFLQYLQGSYPDIFASYFADLPYDKGACKTWTDAETARLKNAWGECANSEGERFVTAQLEYAAIIVQPFFDLVQENLGVDMKRSRALLEMSWCRAIQSGPYGAYNYFKEAFNGKSLDTMSDTEIINTFYDKCEQKIPSMKWRLQNERQDILALVVKTTETNTSTSEP